MGFTFPLAREYLVSEVTLHHRTGRKDNPKGYDPLFQTIYLIGLRISLIANGIECAVDLWFLIQSRNR